MKRVVLDTNVLVSALWNKHGGPAEVVRKVLDGNLTICYDSRIIVEYTDVLYRPEFPFEAADINVLLDWIKEKGLSVVTSKSEIDFIDEDDRMFFDVAVYCNATLITGNIRHYPDEAFIITVAGFLESSAFF